MGHLNNDRPIKLETFHRLTISLKQHFKVKSESTVANQKKLNSDETISNLMSIVHNVIGLNSDTIDHEQNSLHSNLSSKDQDLIILSAFSEIKQLQQSISDATAQGFDPALEYAGDDATTNSTVESINSSKTIINNRTFKIQLALLKELVKLFSVYGLEVSHSVKQLSSAQSEIVNSDGTSVGS